MSGRAHRVRRYGSTRVLPALLARSRRSECLELSYGPDSRQGEVYDEALVAGTFPVGNRHPPALLLVLQGIVGFEEIPSIEGIAGEVMEDKGLDVAYVEFPLQVPHLIPGE